MKTVPLAEKEVKNIKNKQDSLLFATEQEKEEFKKWNDILDELDKELENDDRRHSEKRDYADITLVDCQCTEDSFLSMSCLLKLSCSDMDWIDVIFSRKSEDLYELVSDDIISKAVEALTKIQRDVLFLSVIHGFSTKEIVKILGTSERNIRKHRERAIENIKTYIVDNGITFVFIKDRKLKTKAI